MDYPPDIVQQPTRWRVLYYNEWVCPRLWCHALEDLSGLQEHMEHLRRQMESANTSSGDVTGVGELVFNNFSISASGSST